MEYARTSARRAAQLSHGFLLGLPDKRSNGVFDGEAGRFSAPRPPPLPPDVMQVKHPVGIGGEVQQAAIPGTPGKFPIMPLRAN
jgi:hypothetical protein